MGTNLTDAKLTDIWKSGFCRETVEFARTTEATSEGREKRIEYLTEHIPKCRDCLYANQLKSVESEVAAKMGLPALRLFDLGGDITGLTGFKESFEPLMLTLVQSGAVSEDFIEWMEEMAKRGPYDG